MKHIEQIQPEYAADDMTALLLSDATASAALSRLLHDWTGCAIPPLSDTPQSEVEELVPLCLSILRSHWTTPLTALGDGTTPMSLADLMRRLIGDRVQGNEAWSIPPANANIPTAVSALCDRKIGGVPQAPDGLSFVRILCDSTLSFTELLDDNVGWVMDKTPTLPSTLTKLVLGCKSVAERVIVTNIATLSHIELPHIEVIESLSNKGSTGWGFISKVPIKSLYLPSLIKYDTNNHSSSYEGMIWNCAELEEFIAPNLSHIRPLPNYTDNAMLSKCGALKKIVVGKLKMLTNYNYPSGADSFINTDCPNLIHFEIGEGSAYSIRLTKWSPTTVLSERLDEFLSNFKTYIANRLTDLGSGLTLTLSQAVRDAIQQDPEIVSIITSKGWTISPAPSV
jgi:hypothetical protein